MPMSYLTVTETINEDRQESQDDDASGLSYTTDNNKSLSRLQPIVQKRWLRTRKRQLSVRIQI